jgi:hypothetical protein
MNSLAEQLGLLVGKMVMINLTNKDDSTDEGQVLEINSTEIALLLSAHKDIYEFQLFQKKVREIKLNNLSYFNLISTYNEKLKTCPLESRIQMQKESYIDFNRVLTNFVTSLKSFTDDFLTKNKLPKIYGKDSDQINDFKTKLNHWYDSELSYKFLIRLRDFAIHYDFPISSINFNYTFDDTGTAIEVNCSPEFNKDKLLANSTFRKKTGR